MKNLMLLLLASLGAFVARADTQIAADSAGNPAYDGGWNDGDNGGSGFEPWSIVPSTSAGSPSFETDVQSSIDVGLTGASNADGRAFTARVLAGQNTRGVLAIDRVLSNPIEDGDYYVSFTIEAFSSGNPSTNTYIEVINPQSAGVFAIYSRAPEDNWILNYEFATNVDSGIPKSVPLRVLYKHLGLQGDVFLTPLTGAPSQRYLDYPQTRTGFDNIRIRLTSQNNAETTIAVGSLEVGILIDPLFVDSFESPQTPMQ